MHVSRKDGKTNKQCSVFCIERQCHTSFTLFFFRSHSLPYQPSMIKMQFLAASLPNSRKKKKDGEMGRKMKRMSQKHLLQRDAFHPSRTARSKERRRSTLCFSSLFLTLLFSSTTKTSRHLKTTPLHRELNSPLRTFQSRLFFISFFGYYNSQRSLQSNYTVPSLYLSDRRGAVTEREELKLHRSFEYLTIKLNIHTVFLIIITLGH